MMLGDTGKEHLARALDDTAPFVALFESLIEAELRYP